MENDLRVIKCNLRDLVHEFFLLPETRNSIFLFILSSGRMFANTIMNISISILWEIRFRKYVWVNQKSRYYTFQSSWWFFLLMLKQFGKFRISEMINTSITWEFCRMVRISLRYVIENCKYINNIYVHIIRIVKINIARAPVSSSMPDKTRRRWNECCIDAQWLLISFSLQFRLHFFTQGVEIEKNATIFYLQYTLMIYNPLFIRSRIILWRKVWSYSINVSVRFQFVGCLVKKKNQSK